jgi:hypothetical protein
VKLNRETSTDTIRVSAPVDDPDVPMWNEVMHAMPDPASPDQAVLANVPFIVDGLNFGDLVRVGPEDECGVRPILEVVVPSGCVHVLAATADRAAELVDELEELYPIWAVKVEGADGSLVSISIHPDVDPHEVIGVVADLLEASGEFDPGLEEGPAIGSVCESFPGPIAWPAGRR